MTEDGKPAGADTPLPRDAQLWEAFSVRRKGRLAREEMNRRADQAVKLLSPLRITQSKDRGVARSEVSFGRPR